MEQKLKESSAFSLHIRSYQQSDQNSVLSIWEACNLFPSKSGSDPKNELIISSALPNGEIILGEIDGKIVATIFVASTGINCWIWDLAVHPKWQRQGYGTQMLVYAENWAKRHKAHQTIIFTSKNNASLRFFYETQRYKEVNHTVMSREL